MTHLLRLARLVLLAALVAGLVLNLLSLARFPAYATRYPEVLDPGGDLAPEAVRAALDDLGWSAAAVSMFYVVPALLTLLASEALALIVLRRKGKEWFGLFTALVLLVTAQNGGIFQPILGPVSGLDWWFDFHSLLYWPTRFLFLMVFPDGRFVPRWTRWTLAGWLALLLLDRLGLWSTILFSSLGIPLIAVSIGSLPYRYLRQSSAVERQQIRWVIAAFAVFFSTFPLAVLLARFDQRIDDSILWGVGLLSYWQFGAALIPLSMGLAVLRYRLFDLDFIIRKTLAYGFLSGLLALIYVGTVILLQSMAETIVGQESPVSIVASTLLIAVLFAPLRRWMQATIDRRFYRNKYDAQQVLAQFAAAARNETDLDRLSEQLLRAVQETMEPERIGLWLAGRPGRK